MSFSEKLKEAVATHLVAIGFGAAALLAVAVSNLLPDAFFAAIGEVAGGRIVLGLVFALLIAIAALLALHRRLKFDKRTGTYTDHTGLHYCPRCYVDRSRRMPMREFSSEWWCYICKMGFSNPDYKAPERPAAPLRRAWLMRPWDDRPY